MKAIIVTCPNCGARLPVAETVSSVTCEYCGTASRIQRRTMFLERVMPPPPTGPAQIAVQTHTPQYGAVIGGGVLVSLAIAAVTGYAVFNSVNRAKALTARTHHATASTQKAAVQQAEEAPSWQGPEPLLADADGDGILDVIGRSRRVVKNNSVRVLALSGATGKMLWESEHLGTYEETYQGVLALDEDQIIFVTTRAEVRALALATGKLTWTAQLDERVAYFCRDGEHLLAVGKDDVVRPLRRADGTASSAEVAPAAPRGKRNAKPACTALPTDGRKATLPMDWNLGRAADISARAIYQAPNGGRLVAGTRETGTRVGMLALFDDKKNLRWKITVPQDPLGSVEQAPTHVEVGEREVCLAYYETSIAQPPRFACFSLEDGRRLWDQKIPRSHGLTIAGDRLIVTGSDVMSLDLATGETRWSF